MSRPQTLSGLTEREAIADTMYRVLIGLDHNDISMFNSAFAGNGDDALFIFRGKETKGRDNIKTQIVDVVGPMVTTHTLSNIRVDIKEGSKAAAFNSYVLAQHCPPGRGEEVDGPKWLATAEYFVDLVKDESDESWKIKKWVINVVWSQGDVSIMPKVS
ncbi:hypothetical protein BP6252_11346 [Coleophoma cylindrospora]|uniref:SnoaL-like domain-containing protein n=1 Tax=Coleophoma cylindrospora TaxID=1849047 RepID=A0A3D8QQ07_9HELO|nr:hypothetical protein BP6252_11346 [Coleophoma cylindrospora]